jgi:tryptophan halogenase
MLGQGVVPRDYHPIADSLSDQQLQEKLANMKKLKMEPLSKIPSHDEFLKMFVKSA